MFLWSTLHLTKWSQMTAWLFFNKHTLDTGHRLISCISLYALLVLNKHKRPLQISAALETICSFVIKQAYCVYKQGVGVTLWNRKYFENKKQFRGLYSSNDTFGWSTPVTFFYSPPPFSFSSFLSFQYQSALQTYLVDIVLGHPCPSLGLASQPKVSHKADPPSLHRHSSWLHHCQWERRCRLPTREGSVWISVYEASSQIWILMSC